MTAVVFPPIRFGPFTFDGDTGELTKNGERMSLRPQAAQVLAYLVARPGQLVTREQLRGEVWCAGTYVDFEHGLNLCIHEIRSALRDEASSPRYIETLPRRGYRFVGTIETDDARNAQIDVPQPATSAVASAEVLRRDRAADRWRHVAAILAFVAVVSVVVLSLRSGSRDTNATPAPSLAAVPVALLPLTDIANRPEEDYFVEGVSWELHRQLAGADSLRTTALWSVLPYKRSKKTSREIAGELRVPNLVSGSVYHNGQRVRLNMKLTNADRNETLWAESYDTTLADLPQAEIEISRAIARVLGHGVVFPGRTEPYGQRRVNGDAHAVMLRAMGAQNSEEYRRGLEEAVRIDPKFAYAWTLLANAAISDTWYSQHDPPMVGYPKAKELAMKALAIDDSDSLAHTTVAAVKLHQEWDWAGAEREFRRAIELSPSDAWAHHIYSHYLLTMDRLSESVAESRIASDLDPLNPNLSTCVGWHCLYARQYDDAIAECMKLINDKKAGGVTYYYLGRVYVRQGKLDDGIAALEIAEKKTGSMNAVLATLGYAYGRAGRREDAERVLNVLKERMQRRYVAAFDIAILYAGMGNVEQTFEWLDRAFLERSTWLVHIKWDDRFAMLRHDPRFTALLRRMGVPNPGSIREPETVVADRYSPRAR